jgi:excisionase family DNA binding protein
MKNGSKQQRHIATAVEGAAWISYFEAQRYTGLGRTKIWELVSAGEVEAAKVGRAVRIRRESLEGYMKRHPYVEDQVAW